MTTSSKTEAADRRHGGPGSSHQGGNQPDPDAKGEAKSGGSTNGPDSRVSGGGGEQDRHHGRDPAGK